MTTEQVVLEELAVSAIRNWVLGIDVGERSVGLTAVEYDKKGVPQKILAATSVIHDGGVGDERSRTSRLAQRGGARRLRRLTRHRRARLREVERFVQEQGWVVPSGKDPDRYAAWEARRRLVEETITDNDERRRLLGLAVMHMARHRGWRNPWWSVEALKKALNDAGGPSENLKHDVDAAKQLFTESLEQLEASLDPGTLGRLGALALPHPWWLMDILKHAVAKAGESDESLKIDVDAAKQLFTESLEQLEASLDPGTLGQLGALVLPGARVRLHRAPASKNKSRSQESEDGKKANKKAKEPVPSLLTNRTRQQDVLWELVLIAEKQGLTQSVLDKAIEAIFHQVRPRVPKEHIGRDPLQPEKHRPP